MIRTLISHLELWDAFFCIRIFNMNGQRVLDSVMIFFSRLGDGPLYGVAALAGLLLGGQTGRWFFMTMGIAFAVELPVQKLVKHGLKRPRPCMALPEITHLINMPDEFSFPSGHTAGAFLTATLLAHVAPEWTLPLYVLATLIGLSRVYNGVHYPGDVFMGFVLGVSSARLAIVIL